LSKFEKNLTSIILPVWLPSKDKEKYIKWTLDSLCETTDKNFELIIVNNETKDSDKIFIKKTNILFFIIICNTIYNLQYTLFNIFCPRGQKTRLERFGSQYF